MFELVWSSPYHREFRGRAPLGTGSKSGLVGRPRESYLGLVSGKAERKGHEHEVCPL